MSYWISREDRVPNDRRQVLVFYVAPMTGRRRYALTRFNLDSHGGCFDIERGFLYFLPVAPRVTHWMELTAPDTKDAE